MTRLELGNANDYHAVFGILALCGEYMYRVQGMAHWYPFAEYGYFAVHLSRGEVYKVLYDDLMVGTFALSSQPPLYYYGDLSAWDEPEKPALYFTAFGVLPSHQHLGIGTWCLGEVDRITEEKGYDRVRFDAVWNNTKLLAFYDGRGYGRAGVMREAWGVVQCYEKILK